MKGKTMTDERIALQRVEDEIYAAEGDYEDAILAYREALAERLEPLQAQRAKLQAQLFEREFGLCVDDKVLSDASQRLIDSNIEGIVTEIAFDLRAVTIVWGKPSPILTALSTVEDAMGWRLHYLARVNKQA